VTKKNSVARKSSTHFEQVPLEVVKKIADEENSQKEKGGSDKVRAPKVQR
jgi:hypothetical protein